MNSIMSLTFRWETYLMLQMSSLILLQTGERNVSQIPKRKWWVVQRVARPWNNRICVGRTRTLFIPAVLCLIAPPQVSWTKAVMSHQVIDCDAACSSPKGVEKTARIVVSAVKRKSDGGRLYNKKHYCLFCFKPYSKMTRHLECVRSTEKEVVEACQFSKASKQRKMLFADLRHRGNYVHNAAVMKSGKGELVPYRRPQKKTKGTDFMHCAYC